MLRLLVLGLVLTLAWACEPERRGPADLEAVQGFAGLVAVDEPRAAMVARDLLGNGANAADAAVAIYLAMAVTLPSRVGLLGGGTCLVYSHDREAAEVLEFLPRAGSSGYALPRAVRALAILHARHGRLRWTALVSPAETLARSGHAISRAFARDLAAGADIIRRDRNLSRLFLGGRWAVPSEGDHLVQAELSTVLSGIRSQGAGYFHAGAFPAQLAAVAADSGHPLAIQELRRALPITGPATSLEAGDHRLFFSLPLAGDGAAAATMWRILDEIRPYGAASEEERPGLFVEAAALAFAETRRWRRAGDAGREAASRELLDKSRLQALLPADDTNGAGVLEDSGDRQDGASFVVADRWGDAVACGTTMNGLFGMGRVAVGTGMVLPGRPDPSPARAITASVALLVDPDDEDAQLAVAASGGGAAVSALVQVLLHHLTDRRPLDGAVAAPRLYHDANARAVDFESGASVAGLAARGYRLRQTDRLGRVNALECPEGVADGGARCTVVTDPRGWGAAARIK